MIGSRVRMSASPYAPCHTGTPRFAISTAMPGASAGKRARKNASSSAAAAASTTATGAGAGAAVFARGASG